jgi:hypothetical protein
MTRLVAPLLLLAALAASASGCGYRFLLRDARAPGGISRIQVPLLVNETPQIGLEAELTGHLVDRLDRYQGIEVTDSAPDAVLRGTIRHVGLRPSTAVGSTDTRHQAFRVSLLLDLRLERIDSSEVLWQASGLRRDEDFDTGPVVAGEDILASEDLRSRALAAAGARLIEEGVELMMGGS